METIAGLMAKAPDYVLAISGIIASLTVLTALTPTKLDDRCLGVLTKYVNVVLKLCNLGAGNVLANKNKDDKGKY
jgi:hypothetical protein